MKKTNPLSNCCNKPMTVNTADEGTSCYICSGCNNPCDPVTNPHPNFMDMSKSKQKKILKEAIHGANKMQADMMTRSTDEVLEELKKALKGKLDSSATKKADILYYDELARGRVLGRLYKLLKQAITEAEKRGAREFWEKLKREDAEVLVPDFREEWVDGVNFCNDDYREKAKELLK